MNKVYVIIALAAAGSLVGGIMTLTIGLPVSSCQNTAHTVRTFTIIADLNGFNNSKNHQAPWPVMNVHQCDTVVINVTNSDTQTHGFALDYYAVRGLEIQGQQSQSVTFLASRVGQFRAYCNVFCTVHILMQNGMLNVA